jgi:energy-coupling factor transporter transmembrane protein EcfT
LECRAFGSPAARTYVEEAKLRVGDYVTIAIILLVTVSLVALKATGYSSVRHILRVT